MQTLYSFLWAWAMLSSPLPYILVMLIAQYLALGAGN